MDKDYLSIILGIMSFLLIIITVYFIYILSDFYNDYKCSTTTNIEYFEKHNCIKYYERIGK